MSSPSTWKLGVAFIRGLNMFGKNKITQRQLLRQLKDIETDDLKILSLVKTDDVLFQKRNMHYATAGSMIEKKLKQIFKKPILVTCRSTSTLTKVQTRAKHLMRVKNLTRF